MLKMSLPIKNKIVDRSLAWRRRSRCIWLTIHLYLAMSFGLFFVILGLSGSTNVFLFELEEFSLPRVSHSANAQPLGLDEIMQTVKTAHQQRMGKWAILLPGAGNDYVWVQYPMPAEKADQLFAPLRILVDPYSGKIVAESFWGETLWTVIYELHATLLLGKLGTEIGEIAFQTICFLGLFLFISVLSGLYLWWPSWAKFKAAVSIKQHASIERIYFDVHKTTGFYSAIVLLILALTGFSFSYSDYLMPIIKCFSTVKENHLKDPDVKSVVIDRAKRLSIQAAVLIANDVFPDATLRRVETPLGLEGVYIVTKRQASEANQRWAQSKVWIDQYSGKVLAKQDPNLFTAGETFLNLMWPLHSGEALGLLGRILWCLIGFAPAVLYITGILRWQQKMRAKNKKIQFKRNA